MKVSSTSDYEVTSEGVTEIRSMDEDSFTAQETNAIKSLAAARLQKIKQLES